jgi:hypothetical protein
VVHSVDTPRPELPDVAEATTLAQGFHRKALSEGDSPTHGLTRAAPASTPTEANGENVTVELDHAASV